MSKLAPIERDEPFDRTYIPLPGGWEVQTKGKGSTFRICEPGHSRLPIPDSPYLHETLERMALEVHAAHVAALTEVDDAMVDIVGSALYVYWNDVNEAARNAYRKKVRAALTSAFVRRGQE